MEHMLPQSPLTSHYDHWSPYHEHGIDHAGDSYITAHHVNVEQGNYQVSYTVYIRFLMRSSHPLRLQRLELALWTFSSPGLCDLPE